MPQATTKTYQLFRETLLNATSDEHKAEIMELKKGCRVFIQNYYISIEILIDKTDWTRISKEDYPLDFIGFSGSETLQNFDKKHIKEIIGRDLTLEDVLTAIKNKRITERITDVDSIDFGENIEITAYLFQEIASEWNLTKPAHLQSEETLLAIINLLK